MWFADSFRFCRSKRGLEGREVRYAAAANLRGFGVPNVIGDHELNDGNLLVQLDGNSISATGSATIDGAMFDLEWRRSFRSAGSAIGLLSLAANLDEGNRRQLGLPTAPRVTGLTRSAHKF